LTFASNHRIDVFRPREIALSDANKIAVDALQQRAIELIAERKNVRRRLLGDSIRDQQIDRDLNGCVAGARALESELTLPPNTFANPPIQAQLNAFVQSRNAIAAAAPQLGPEFGLESGGPVDEGDEAELQPEMPRSADIIVDRLTVAGTDGSKAAEIRRFILNTYDADIHEKTVGMTLYRLQKDGVVRRDGHVWFLGPPEVDEPAPVAAG
jgi:hypothetical protein